MGSQVRVGSLFAGMGGFDEAAKVVGWRTAWVSEIEPYACALLEYFFPGVPNHGDIIQIDFTRVEPVEVLCGGFPCQDISKAGNGDGIDGKRSGLWSHYARAIGVLRPRYAVVENVPTLTRRGLGRVLGDLADLGYDAEWHCLSAAHVGAPHGRDRIWICAYPFGAVADSDGLGWLHRSLDQLTTSPGWDAECDVGAGGANVAHGHWAVEPAVGRLVDGLPYREERIACLGNAIVPQVAELLFRAIQAREEMRANAPRA